MPNVTPVAERLRHMVEARFDEINRDKLTRWLMSRAAQKDLGITDCRGRPISVGIGCVFEGQLRKIFWAFIKPCIEDLVQECCNEMEKAFNIYTQQQRIETLEYMEVILKSFASRIYCRMVELDRLMRGQGYPRSVEPYDPSREIGAAHQLIEFKLGVLAKHYTGKNNPQQPSLIDAIDSKVRLPIFGIGIDVAKVWKWLMSILSKAKTALSRWQLARRSR